MNENNPFYCSFVSIDYIICECGENFASEDELKEHLEKDKIQHQLKLQQRDVIVINEYKCGTCEEIFDTAEECMKHQDLTHVDASTEEKTVTQDYVLPKIKQEIKEEDDTKFRIKEIIRNPPIRVQSLPVKVKYENVKCEVVKHENVKSMFFKNEIIKNENVIHEDVKHIKQEIVEDDYHTYIKYDVDDDNVFSFIPRADYLSRRVKVKCVPPKPEILQLRKEKKKQKPASSDMRQAVCEVCGKKYTSNVALKYHQRVHTGEYPYPCAYCPKKFTMPLFQQIHMRIHTGERPYECEMCPKAFTNRAALLRHNRVHTGEKPYECPKCGKAFSQSNSLKLHVHTVHLKMPAPYKSKKRRAQAISNLNRKEEEESSLREYKISSPVFNAASTRSIVKINTSAAKGAVKKRRENTDDEDYAKEEQVVELDEIVEMETSNSFQIYYTV